MLYQSRTESRLSDFNLLCLFLSLSRSRKRDVKHAVLCRRHTRFLLEHTTHVLGILKAYLIADVGDRPAGVGK